MLETIVAIQDELRRVVDRNLGWVAREKLNVGVFRFGNSRLDEIDRDVRWALSEVKATAFDLVLKGVATVQHRFDDGHRSLYLDGGSCQPLVDLAARLSSGVNRPPHLTLARYRAQMPVPEVKFAPVVFRADRLVLVKSIREGAEAGYHVLNEWVLPQPEAG